MFYFLAQVPGTQQAIDGLQKTIDHASKQDVNWVMTAVAVVASIVAGLAVRRMWSRGEQAQDEVRDFAQAEGTVVSNYENLSKQLIKGNDEIQKAQSRQEINQSRQEILLTQIRDFLLQRRR